MTSKQVIYDSSRGVYYSLQGEKGLNELEGLDDSSMMQQIDYKFGGLEKKDERNSSTTQVPELIRFIKMSSDSKDIRLSPSGLHLKISKAHANSKANVRVNHNIAFHQGVHEWEYFCPVKCNDIQFGVTNTGSYHDLKVTYKASTTRHIHVILDCGKGTYTSYLNRELKTKKVSKIPFEGPYIPFIQTKTDNVRVVLNPYARLGNYYQNLGNKFSLRDQTKFDLSSTVGFINMPTDIGCAIPPVWVLDTLGIDQANVENVVCEYKEGSSDTTQGWALVRFNSKDKAEEWKATKVCVAGPANKELLPMQLMDIINHKEGGETKLDDQEMAIKAHFSNTEKCYGSYEDMLKAVQGFMQSLLDCPETKVDLSGFNIKHLSFTDQLLIQREGSCYILDRVNGEFPVQQACLRILYSEDTHSQLVMEREKLVQLLTNFEWGRLGGTDSYDLYQEVFSSLSAGMKMVGGIVSMSYEGTKLKSVFDDILYHMSNQMREAGKVFQPLEVPSLDKRVFKFKRPLLEESKETASGLGLDPVVAPSVNTLNEIMDTLVRLDEQIWAHSLANTNLQTAYTGSSRPFSAMSRKQSFLNWSYEPSQISSDKLASLGFVVEDNHMLRNVYGGSKDMVKISSQSKLQDTQSLFGLLSNNHRLARGLPVPNVPLEESSNLINQFELRGRVVESLISDFMGVFYDEGKVEVRSGLCRSQVLLSTDFSKTSTKAQTTNLAEHTKCLQKVMKMITDSPQRESIKINGSEEEAKSSPVKQTKKEKKQKKSAAKKKKKAKKVKKQKKIPTPLSSQASDCSLKQEDDTSELSILKPHKSISKNPSPAFKKVKKKLSKIADEIIVVSEEEEKGSAEKEESSGRLTVGLSFNPKPAFNCELGPLSISAIQLDPEQGTLSLVTRGFHYNLKTLDNFLLTLNQGEIVNQLKGSILSHPDGFESPTDVYTQLLKESKPEIFENWANFVGGHVSGKKSWNGLRKKTSPLFTRTSESVLDLSDSIDTYLAHTEQINSLDDTQNIFILGLDSHDNLTLVKVGIFTIDETQVSAEVFDTVKMSNKVGKESMCGVYCVDEVIAVCIPDQINVYNKMDLKLIKTIPTFVRKFSSGQVLNKTGGWNRDVFREIRVGERSTQDMPQVFDLVLVDANGKPHSFEICGKVPEVEKVGQVVKPVSIQDLKSGNLINLTVLESAFKTKDAEIVQHTISDGSHEFTFKHPQQSLAKAELYLNLTSKKGLQCDIKSRPATPAATGEAQELTLTLEQYGGSQSIAGMFNNALLRSEQYHNVILEAKSKSNRLTLQADLPSSFITNYPSPFYIVKQAEGLPFTPTQFRFASENVKSNSNPSSYPIGSGLVFGSNSLDALAHMKEYAHIQTQAQWDRWVEDRKKMTLPHQETEPIGFFDMGAEVNRRFDLEYQKQCHYFAFLPTDFRKAPIRFSKKFNQYNAECLGFGVFGIVGGEPAEKSGCYVDAGNDKLGVKVEIHNGGEWKDVATLDSIQIDQIRGMSNQTYDIGLHTKLQDTTLNAESTIALPLNTSGGKLRVTIKDHDEWEVNNVHLSASAYSQQSQDRVSMESIRAMLSDETLYHQFIKDLVDYAMNQKGNPIYRGQAFQYLKVVKSAKASEIVRANLDFSELLSDRQFKQFSQELKSTIISSAVEHLKEGLMASLIETKLKEIESENGLQTMDLKSLITILRNISKEDSERLVPQIEQTLYGTLIKQHLKHLQPLGQYTKFELDPSVNSNLQAKVSLENSGGSYVYNIKPGKTATVDQIQLLFDCTLDQQISKLNQGIRCKVRPANADLKEPRVPFNFSVDVFKGSQVENEMKYTLKHSEEYSEYQFRQLTSPELSAEDCDGRNEVSNVLTLNNLDINSADFIRIEIKFTESQYSKTKKPDILILPVLHGYETLKSDLVGGVEPTEEEHPFDNHFEAIQQGIGDCTKVVMNEHEFIIHKSNSSYLIQTKGQGVDENQDTQEDVQTHQGFNLTQTLVLISTLSDILITSNVYSNQLPVDEDQALGYCKAILYHIALKETEPKYRDSACKLLEGMVKCLNEDQKQKFYFDIAQSMVGKKGVGHLELFTQLDSYFQVPISHLIRGMAQLAQVESKAAGVQKELTLDDLVQIFRDQRKKLSKKVSYTCMGCISSIQNLINARNSSKSENNEQEHLTTEDIALLYKIFGANFDTTNDESFHMQRVLLGLITPTSSKQTKLEDLIHDVKTLVKVALNILTQSKSEILQDLTKLVEVYIGEKDNARLLKSVFKCVQKLLEGGQASGLNEEEMNLLNYDSNHPIVIDVLIKIMKVTKNDEPEEFNDFIQSYYTSKFNTLQISDTETVDQYLSRVDEQWAKLYKNLELIQHVPMLQDSEQANAMLTKFVQMLIDLPEVAQEAIYPSLHKVPVEKVTTDQCPDGYLSIRFILKTIKEFIKLGMKDTYSYTQHNRIYCICDAWLILFKLDSFKSNSDPLTSESNYILNPMDFHYLLTTFQEYLMSHLNYSCYTGFIAADRKIYVRMELARSMINMLEKNFSFGLGDYIRNDDACSLDSKADVLSNLMLWQLINHQAAPNDPDPMSTIHKSIMESLAKLFKEVKTQEGLVLKLLPTLMKQVIFLDETIRDKIQQIGADRALHFQESANKLFKDYFHEWVNDKTAKKFLLEMNGFDFLLDRLFKSAEEEVAEPEKVVDEAEVEEEVKGGTEEEAKSSDSDEDFSSNLFGIAAPISAAKEVKPKKTGDKEEKKEAEAIDQTKLKTQDFANSVKMVHVDGVSDYQTYAMSTHKNCSKNRQMWRQLKKNQYYDYHFQMELTEQVDLTEIQIGMLFHWSTYDNDMQYEPLSVMLEGGTTKQKVDWRVILHPVHDPGYEANSIRVYGVSFIHSTSQAPHIGNGWQKDMIQDKLSQLGVKRARYLTLKLRKPTIASLSHSSHCANKDKSRSYSFSYMSFMGVPASQSTNVKQCINDMQKENSLEILSEFITGDFNETFGVIAEDETVVARFIQQFSKFTLLFKDKGELIKPILLAICSKNKQMGELLMSNLMKEISDPAMAQFLGEIITADRNEQADRLPKFWEAILKEIRECDMSDKAKAKSMVEKTGQIVKIFVQKVREVQDQLDRPDQVIELELSLEDLDRLLTLLSLEGEAIKQLLVTLLTLKEPFRLSSLSQDQIVQHLTRSKEDNKNSYETSLHVFSILVSSREALVPNLIDMDLLKDGDMGLIRGITDESLSIVQFWYNCAHQPKVKEYLKDSYIPIYDSLQAIFNKPSFDSKKSKDFVTYTVELLKLIIAGDEERESDFAKRLTKEVKAFSEQGKEGNLEFMNQVNVPLLHVQPTIPVTLQIKDTKEGLMKPIYGSAGSQPSHTSRFLLDSKILDKDQQDAFMGVWNKHVKEKSPVFKDLSKAKWEMIFEDKNPKVGGFKPFALAVDNQQYTIHLLQCTVNGAQVYFGGFCHSMFPNCSSMMQEYDYQIPNDPANFVFYYKDQKRNHFELTNNKPFGYVYTDYEQGGALSVCGDFFLCSWSYDFSNSSGNVYDMQCMEQASFPSFYSTMQINSYQCWKCVMGSSRGADDSLGETEYHKSPMYQSICPQNLFETNVVFQVPTGMNVLNVCKEILGGRKELKLVGGEPFSFDTNLKDLPTQDGFVKFYYDKKVLVGDDKEASDDEISEVYQPEMGVLAKFDGMSDLISIAKAAVDSYENQDLKQAWASWLEDTATFTKVPGFFKELFSNEEYQNLIFDLISGSPDSESIAFEKEWKEKEQSHNAAWKKKNYYSNNKPTPLKKDPNPWLDRQAKIVKESYRILMESNDHSQIDVSTLERFLERVGSLAGEAKRSKTEVIKEESPGQEDGEEQVVSPAKTDLNKDKLKKRHGVGYTTGTGTEWDVIGYMKSKEDKNAQIRGIVGIIKAVLQQREGEEKAAIIDLLLESALLLVIENALRSGSLLEMAKEYDLFISYLDFIQAVALDPLAVKLLVDIGPLYAPPQIDSVAKLLSKLQGLAQIFLTALTASVADAESEKPRNLAKKIGEVNEIVQEKVKAIEDKKQADSFKKLLSLPLPKAYRELLSPLRFDYMSMKAAGNVYKHYYQSTFSGKTPSNQTIVRLAQEMADMSNSLPDDHTNAIFVRVDKDRVDVMKALIMGAARTPYAHGAFEYDLYFDESYPNSSPKCQLVTTGNGQVRFNPNLYANGKVCLSLLGTWRGSATENWDPKFSTIIQVLLSIQAIIMSEEVYFNEPGYEHEIGTAEGERKNDGYSNVVRYCNIKYAMLEQIKNPSKGFEVAIRRHFYLKRHEVMDECKDWLELIKDQNPSYESLVNDHNRKWCEQFKKPGFFEKMMKEVVADLETALKGIKPSTLSDERVGGEGGGQGSKESAEKEKAKKQAVKEKLEQANKQLEEIDVQDDEEQVDTKTIDIKDEKVKDRWSRYIGAMGIEAVAKQANARIFIDNLSPVAMEIAKNLVLAGCKEIIINDTQPTEWEDLSGNFFVNEAAVKNKLTRAQASKQKLQQLNYYVKVTVKALSHDNDEIYAEGSGLETCDVVIMSNRPEFKHQDKMNKFCREKGIKYIQADCYGVFARVFNDFGDKFEVLDKDGEELTEVMIESISSEEKGLVKLLEGYKHNLEDGDEIVIRKVKGMLLKSDETKSINETIHKVVTQTPSSFLIGDTTGYTDYESSGLAKQMKTKKMLEFKSLEEIKKKPEDAPFDPNLLIADFEKMDHFKWAEKLWEFLSLATAKKKPAPWELDYLDSFFDAVEGSNAASNSDLDLLEQEPFFLKFMMSNSGQFPPLCAFIGGVVAQEVIKAITQKFCPIHQIMHYNLSELMPDSKLEEFDENPDEFKNKYGYSNIANDRYRGLTICLGKTLVSKIQSSRIFMVGAGAIGCELLKNFAMLGAGSGEDGYIKMTDPDVIETSNLNRQFLFREKHLRKAKSLTAAAAAIQMNPDLKNHVDARLDKIHKGTEDVYDDEFFQSLTILTNALDNVQARRYLDERTVKNRIPMIDSGTLGPKGHVQVVLPNQTESYASTNDAEDTTEIPVCTLKMFPEETLHCVEWARDKFGKLFTLHPKNYNKVLEDDPEEALNPENQARLQDALKMHAKRPKDFDECLHWARRKFNKYFCTDVKQLLFVYPLDKKNKEGKLFWSLPKRPPRHLEYDPKNLKHARFIAAAACIRATLFNIELPKEPRKESSILEMGLQADEFEVPKWEPDKEKAEALAKEVADQESKKEEESKGDESEEEEVVATTDDFAVLKEGYQEALLPLHNKMAGLKEGDAPLMLKAEEFEKDNDANFHIDFISSMANLRSNNYELEEMDWITVKLKAGRIIPALATTTASIAALQTIEAIKYINETDLEKVRNANLNLAVPSLMVSEPGPPQKYELREGLEVTLWDEWEVQAELETTTLGEVISDLETTYKLLVRDIFEGSKPVYLHSLMELEMNKDKKEEAQKSTVQKLLGLKKGVKDVMLTVTFVDPNDKEEKIIKNVPKITVQFF